MPGRKAPSGIRSGRFKGPDPAQAIISTVGPQNYRVFNTGDDKFTVVINPGNTRIVVRKQCSADIRVPASSSVVITDFDDPVMPAEPATPPEKIEGVYDLIGAEVAVRSGRFKSKLSNSKPIELIKRRAAILYRVFNTGERAFYFNEDTTTAVPPKCSRDLALNSNAIFKIKSANDQLISGVYDSLDETGPIRSGRFEFTEQNPAIEHLLIDLSSADGDYVYRVTNAGDEPFDVYAPGAVKLATLKRNQSFDFQISSDSAANLKITVKGAANKTITGIYDFLGTA